MSLARWLSNNEPVFWIQGKPGSGKSTLMNYLSKVDQVPWLLNAHSGSQWTVIRFFFDAGSGTNIGNSFEGLLRSLILQMLEQEPDLESDLRQFRNKSYLPGETSISRWDDASLNEAFRCGLAKSSKRFCILIDGLDEYRGEICVLLMFFLNIAKREGLEARHKVCLASRPEKTLAPSLEKYPGFRLQDHNTVAIAKYVSSMMESAIPWNEEQGLREFSYNVADKAEGVFLWARFAVSEIIQASCGGDSLKELNDRLEQIPPEMDGMYTNVLGRLSKNDQHEAQLMFQLVCFAKMVSYGESSLTLLQLKEAMAVARNKGAVDPADEDQMHDLRAFRRRVRAKCGDMLVEVSDSEPSSSLQNFDDIGINGRLVRLIHRTAKSYLEQEGWLNSCYLQDDYFSPHALWLEICCKHLQDCLGPPSMRSRYTTAPDIEGPTQKFLVPSVKHSLIQYAYYNLFYHARSMELVDCKSSYDHLKLLSPAVLAYLRENNKDVFAVQFPDATTSTKPWQIVVEQGLELCSDDIISKRLYTPRGDDEIISHMILLWFHYGWTQAEANRDPLQLERLTRKFLESGATVSRKTIIICLHCGDASVLELLLDTSPEVAMDNDFLWELASSRDELTPFPAMLNVVFARNQDLVHYSGPEGNMLHMLIVSCIERRRSVTLMTRAKALLDHGVNVKVRSFQLRALFLPFSASLESFRLPLEEEDSCTEFSGICISVMKLKYANNGGTLRLLVPEVHRYSLLGGFFIPHRYLSYYALI